MRVLKEVLVLAVIVLVFAYAARRLEGVDAGEINAGVPPLMQSVKQMLGWDDGPREKASKHAAPAKSTEPSKPAAPSN
ncbi:hypothetical protein [Methyloceanibacter sp. wino2]|uniref:hypothetical protein n=1 Tax=Methyloceanibacter sp. wino2 TaxID=2170729 RepID=UPI000D3E9615|nr:hypothetical protein [Methyloceanibacter sp. wino2]